MIITQTPLRISLAGGGTDFKDFYTKEGEPLPIDPRQLLKKVRKEAHDLGFLPVFAQETEWFNFQETPQGLQEKGFLSPLPIAPSPPGFGYSIVRASAHRAYFSELFNFLRSFGIPLEGLHTETGPGVYEAAIAYSDVLEAGDRAVLFKTAVKEIAHRHAIMPSFMAKWNPQLPGCSGHIHQSLCDDVVQNNLFYDEEDPHHMSLLMKQYLSGVLRCLPVLMPLYAPTINSYKRLVEGVWAPTTATWGIENRTTAVRVISGSRDSCRIEFRVPGADINPYLAMAGSLASGLYGIKHQWSLDIPMTQGNGYKEEGYGPLPRTLEEALDRMKRSDIPNELLGEAFVTHFIQTREWECREFNRAVTDWELKRYFEII